MKRLYFTTVLLLMGVCIHAQSISNVSFAPRQPWNGLVDISFTLDGDFPEYGELASCSIWITRNYSVHFTGYDQDRNQTVAIQTLAGQTTGFTEAGDYSVVWNAGADYPEFASSSFRISAMLQQPPFSVPAIATPSVEGEPNSTYLVIDLSGGSNADSYPCRYTNTAPDLSNDTCRTTELWLRRIPAGTFVMGSPEDELGRVWYYDETQHRVTLTQDYFIGVFEMTQKQYKLVMMGSNPSGYRGDTRPVEGVSYDDLRGTSAEGGAGWPEKGHTVDATSFFGILRAKTGLCFDLPTESQWEYACRAGTTTALNSGKDLTDESECPNMAEVGRYARNRDDGKGGYGEHTKVGCYLPNAWGLYDMHGNVLEWCLDWQGDYPKKAVIDPGGANSGSYRVKRGGYWRSSARNCRSAFRYGNNPSIRGDGYGFRVVCLP